MPQINMAIPLRVKKIKSVKKKSRQNNEMDKERKMDNKNKIIINIRIGRKIDTCPLGK